MLETGRISPRTPQMTVVSPILTVAEPWAWERAPKFMIGGRGWAGCRPFVREGFVEEVVGWRLARRKSWGASFAKVERGRERDGAYIDAMVVSYLCIIQWWCCVIRARICMTRQ